MFAKIHTKHKHTHMDIFFIHISSNPLMDFQIKCKYYEEREKKNAETKKTDQFPNSFIECNIF